jgi:UDP-2,4-diacetamido-2,4,6-trideoxy-beta-L-altropyranose hydrolase
MQQPQAIIRCEAGGTTGLGHAVRCSALAGRLHQAGWRVSVAISDGGYAAVPDLAALPRLRPEDAVETPADLVILDGYDFGIELEQKFRRAGRKLLVIDDAPTRPHDAHILLDSTLGRDGDDYASLAPAACILAGAAYVPIRPTFRRARAERWHRLKTSPDATVQRVLVSFGGTDPLNHTGKILTALAEHAPALSFVVVMGPSAAHLHSVRTQVVALPGAELHVAPPDMAGLMARCDLAIGAGGTSSWERCCLGLPTLVLVIAENQRPGAERLAAAGAAWLVEDDSTAIAERFAALLADATARATMAKAGRALIDGRGLDRILLPLMPSQSILDGRVSLRLMEASDEALLLTWQRHPETRRYARSGISPSEAEHAAWYRQLLEDPGRLPFFVQEDTPMGPQPVGYVRLDWRAEPVPGWEISIATAPDHYRRGIGRAALSLASVLVPREAILAHVLPENDASHGLFRAAGYLPFTEGWYRLSPRLTESVA